MQSAAPAVTQRGKGSQREALLAQWLERAAVNRKVTGSIPVGSVLFLIHELLFVKAIIPACTRRKWFCGLMDKASPS